MYQEIANGICAPQGFSANGLHCGIRNNSKKKDLTLIYSDTLCNAAAIYTQNAVKGAPIAICKSHLEDGVAQAIIINSGNANTCNADGEMIANQMCELSAAALNIDSNNMLIASTGVIGEPLKLQPIVAKIPELVDGLSRDKASDAWEGISTTDTHEKQFAIKFELNNKMVTLGAMAKGSGMIHPNMATMLGFITSDVAISSDMLTQMLKEVADETFNMVSVDGDTSTNDTLAILCNGKAQNAPIASVGTNYDIFKAALTHICILISKAIAADGEGATKLLTCKVNGAADLLSARKVAKSIITSSLVKSAMFGNDANWGRILCAIGYANVQLDPQQVDVSLNSEAGSLMVCENGSGVGFDETKALEILKAKEVIIEVNLHDGFYKATAWGCDLTYEYVKINGEYRT